MATPPHFILSQPAKQPARLPGAKRTKGRRIVFAV
jgi:hypothetical protein